VRALLLLTLLALLLVLTCILFRSAIVVMFCDICDSTAMSEELDAEDVREVVLVYQAFVGEVTPPCRPVCGPPAAC